MSLLARRIIFYLLLFTFIIIAPLIVGYATGYRWSPAQRQIVKTGALSITTIPSGAAITLNNRPIPAYSPALITNLLPGSYKIELSKEGYHPWIKTLTVEDGQATFAHNVSFFRAASGPESSSLKETPPASETTPASFENLKVWHDRNLKKIIVTDNNLQKRLVEIDAQSAIWRTSPTPLLFAYTNHEIWQYNPQNRIVTLITRLTENIRSITVLPREEAILITIAQDTPISRQYTIRALELDLRDQQNSWDLAHFDDIRNAALAPGNKIYTVWGTYQGKKGVWSIPLK